MQKAGHHIAGKTKGLFPFARVNTGDSDQI
jgi:hypothetical protein